MRTRSLRNTIDSKMSENKNVRLRNTIDYKVTEDKFCSLLSTQSLAEMDSMAWLVSGAHIPSRLRIGLGAVYILVHCLANMRLLSVPLMLQSTFEDSVGFLPKKLRWGLRW